MTYKPPHNIKCSATKETSLSPPDKHRSSDEYPRWLDDKHYELIGAIPFLFFHLSVIGIYWSGVTTEAIICCVTLFLIRMWGVTGGYHRYFSHRTFETSRIFQFILAFIAQTSAQKGVLWWAAHHRRHHKYSDRKGDIHSPIRDGFFFSHVGWLFIVGCPNTDYARIQDFAQFPELRLLNRLWVLPPLLLGLSVYLLLGWSGLFVGFFLSTIAVFHSTFFVNSLAHIFGKRRFNTKDQSRNSFLLSILTLGEGWHNNHHHYQSSARNGFYWWEIDITYYILKILGWLGLIWNIRPVPSQILQKKS